MRDAFYHRIIVSVAALLNVYLIYYSNTAAGGGGSQIKRKLKS